MIKYLSGLFKKGRESYIKSWNEQSNFQKYGGIGFTLLVVLIELFGTEEQREQFSKYLNLLAILFLMALYRGIKKSKQALAEKNNEIEFQKRLVEEHQQEIIDSINYAQRIQKALLAGDDLLKKHLEDHFILFKPKDIVSGDFYWAAELHNGQFAVVTADSTGHGVPGAIMSMLNISCLEKAIEVGHHSRPDEILNHTRDKIIETLKKDGSHEGGKDGMDCSVISFDAGNKRLLIANANNPVWIVRKQELIEIRGDKMPVGKHEKDQVPFTLKTFDLVKGDMVYALTDGFSDQFGGEKGKKFMSKNLKELLVSNAHLSMAEQKQVIETAFKDWTGGLEQVDDVTIIGIKV